MTILARARIVKGAYPDTTEPPATRRVELGRRVPREALEAKEEAAGIVADAHAKAEAIVAEARARAEAVANESAKEAREREIARLAAEHLALRVTEERRAERELERTKAVAVLLAERIVGEALRVEPERIAAIAAEALRETRGARQVRIEASPDDAAALASLLGEGVAEITAAPALARGSLVVHTELGRVDARLEPQLQRLAEALREALT